MKKVMKCTCCFVNVMLWHSTTTSYKLVTAIVMDGDRVTTSVFSAFCNGEQLLSLETLPDRERVGTFWLPAGQQAALFCNHIHSLQCVNLFYTLTMNRWICHFLERKASNSHNSPIDYRCFRFYLSLSVAALIVTNWEQCPVTLKPNQCTKNVCINTVIPLCQIL